MQIFLFVALAISLVAVLFALQNIVPVTVGFLAWTFEGSLALVLFVSLMAGALISFLASLPTLVRHRWATKHHGKQVASLEASMADCQRRLQDAEARLKTQGSPQGLAPVRRPGGRDSSLEPSA